MLTRPPACSEVKHRVPQSAKPYVRPAESLCRSTARVRSSLGPSTSEPSGMAVALLTARAAWRAERSKGPSRAFRVLGRRVRRRQHAAALTSSGDLSVVAKLASSRSDKRPFALRCAAVRAIVRQCCLLIFRYRAAPLSAARARHTSAGKLLPARRACDRSASHAAAAALWLCRAQVFLSYASRQALGRCAALCAGKALCTNGLL